jgi:hypothetical protein
VAYTFLSRSAPPPLTIIPEVNGTIGTTDETTNAWKSQVPSSYTFGKGSISMISDYLAGNQSFFGELSLAEYPEITKFKTEFILSAYSPNTFTIVINGDNGNGAISGTKQDCQLELLGTNLKVYYPKSTNTLADTITGINVGDKIAMLVEQGKVTIYVNDIEESVISNVGITFSKIISSFGMNKAGTTLTNIKQKMYFD